MNYRKDRGISRQAVVTPDANDILLGALPLEGMDLYVDPVNQRLAGVHGDRRIHLVRQTFGKHPAAAYIAQTKTTFLQPEQRLCAAKTRAAKMRAEAGAGMERSGMIRP
ncbi:MAG: hypothetical protein LBS06_03520 [Treponema sp.]|nr:hypothetical protein [Treponema sp.]